MKILAIDTTTEACSAALQVGEEVHELYEVAPRKHAELILPMVDRLLSESGTRLSELDCLAFTRGPGAFTGVRLCTSVAQGLAYASDLPVVGVSTLATLAQASRNKASTILSAIDARMGETYAGLFSAGEKECVTPISAEIVSAAEELSIEFREDCFGCGSAWQKYQDELSRLCGTHLSGFDPGQLPRARDVLPLACKELKGNRAVNAPRAMPVYLRNKVTS